MELVLIGPHTIKNYTSYKETVGVSNDMAYMPISFYSMIEIAYLYDDQAYRIIEELHE